MILMNIECLLMIINMKIECLLMIINMHIECLLTIMIPMMGMISAANAAIPNTGKGNQYLSIQYYRFMTRLHVYIQISRIDIQVN